jgi:DNA-binding transcriptional MerR regulator
VGPVPDEDDMALEELVKEAGVEVETVRDLERYGLITPRVIGGVAYYSHEAATISRLAAAFARHGVEARHLRAYKGAAEREAGIVQQVIMPLIRQRNPHARLEAARAVDELSELGGQLRTALLRSALADLR